MKKKLLALLLVLVLSTGFLTACTPENPGNTDTSSNSVLASSDTDSGETNGVASQTDTSQTDTSQTDTSQTDTDEKTSTEEEGDTTDLGEIPEFEKLYNLDLSVDADFDDNVVLVTFMPNVYGKEYTVQDFEEIGCAEIRQVKTFFQRHSETGKEYPCTYLYLVLDKHSKENVLNAVRILEQWPSVRCASVNLYYETMDAPTAQPTDPQFA